MNDLTPARFLGPIKVQGASEKITRKAAQPHYLEVLRQAHSLLGEIEEALEMRSGTKKAALALLARSYELNRVVLGQLLMAAGGKEDWIQESDGGEGHDDPITVSLERGRC